MVGSAALWTPILWAIRLSQWQAPEAVTFFLPIVGVGLPAFFVGALAYRWRLPQPVAWSTLGYCLGSAVATAISEAQYWASLGEPLSWSRVFLTTLYHTVTLTLAVPARPGPWSYLVGNLLWVVVAVASAVYGIETYRGRGPLERKK